MNKVVLVGNLTRDPELRQTASGVSVCNFTIAVNRRFTNAQGEREADFINCVAWRTTGEFISKYFHNGKKIGVAGNIQTRTYEDNNGQKRYATEVVVDEAEFVESASNAQNPGPVETEAARMRASEAHQEEMTFTQVDDDDLPF